MQAYNEAIAKAKPPSTGKFSDLITVYKRSAEFTTRRAKTQKDYLRYIALIETKFGSMPISALGAPAVRGVFKEWKDELAQHGLRHADYAWTVLQRILSVAKDRGKISTNPCERGGRLYEAERSDKLWTDDHVKQFLDKAPKHLRLPLMLALWTGQRQGDLLRLPWSAYDGQFIRLRQRKGKRGKGRRVKIPVGTETAKQAAKQPIRSRLFSAEKRELCRDFNSGRTRTRTLDPLIKSPLIFVIDQHPFRHDLLVFSR
jgi:integrase